MSLLSMATSGLKSFVSNVKNTVVATVAAGVAAYNSLMSGQLISGLLGNAGSSFIDGLSSGSTGLTGSDAGNYNAGGNKRDNSIYDYLTNFKSGIMKSSRFRAEFNLPKGVAGSSSMHSVNSNVKRAAIKTNGNSFNGNGSINVKCHTASFPARSIQTLEFRSNSVNFKVPYAINYEPISLMFYANANMDSREYFELWQAAVMNFGNNTANFYNEYTSDVKLYLQNDYGEDTYGIILYECFPLNINVLEISYATTNTPVNVMVTLAYKSWLPLTKGASQNRFNRTI